jgi:adhesin transport system outer membrane protein
MWSMVSTPLSAQNLQGLFTLLLENDPTIKANQALNQAATSELKSARWEYYPTPNLGIQAQPQANTGLTRKNVYNAVLSLRQPLWTWGLIDANVKATEANLKATKANTRLVKLERCLALLQSYTDGLNGRLQRQVAKNSVISHQDLLVQIKRRAQEGVAATSDLDIAIARLYDAESILEEAKTQSKQGLIAIHNAIQKSINEEALWGSIHLPILFNQDTLMVIDHAYHNMDTQQYFEQWQPLGKHPSISPQKTENLIEQALTISPVIAQAEAQITEAMAFIEQSEAKIKPALHLRVERNFGTFNRAIDNEVKYYVEGTLKNSVIEKCRLIK